MNLKNKNLMLNEDTLIIFDDLVGKQKRSKVIRELIEAYIKNPDIFSMNKKCGTK